MTRNIKLVATTTRTPFEVVKKLWQDVRMGRRNLYI